MDRGDGNSQENGLPGAAVLPGGDGHPCGVSRSRTTSVLAGQLPPLFIGVFYMPLESQP